MRRFLKRLLQFAAIPTMIAVAWTVFVVVMEHRSYVSALPLAEGEHYIPDLIGLKVLDEAERELGQLKDVLATGANDVYIVSVPGKKDLLIPAIPDCILEVNVEEGFMKVHLLEGLEDL